MRILPLVFAALGCCESLFPRTKEQTPLDGNLKHKVKNVAVIGAGAAGASSAYHLAKYARNASIPVNITVFERNPYIGGRSTTVNAYDDPQYPVELGASIFVAVNRILVDAVKEFNLSTSGFLSDSGVPGAALAVWNGGEFVMTQNGGSGWWDIVKLLWKYGLAPIKTVRLVKAVVAKFLIMYEEPVFPFASLTQAAQDVQLLNTVATTGTQFMEEHGITGDFGRDIVQATTRVNYAQNLDYIHGLEAMVSMAAENAQSVRGGNWQIFAGMVQASNATLLLDTAVSTIEKTKQGGYALKVSDVSPASKDEHTVQTFDAVVLAAPYQFSEIDTINLESPPESIPYVELHVTLFTSPHLMSPGFFNLSAEEPSPRVVLTTLPKQEQPHTGPRGVGSPGFFSISLLSSVTNPTTGGEEYLYKIFSASPPNSTFLAHLLGLKQGSDGKGSDISDKEVTWIYRKVWNSYPYEYPRVTFERLELDDGLWYTGGMDSFISTMETNALMGKNVARLVVDSWLDGGETLAR